MTTAERYRRLSVDFGKVVTALGPDEWTRPSPCEGWTAHDVLEHVLGSQADVISRVGLQIERTIDVSNDPIGAWHEVRDAVQEVLDDPARASLAYESLGAQTTIAESIDKFLCFDLTVHRWDIAVAAGRQIVMSDQDIADAHAFLDEMGSMFYDYGASAPARPVADDAPAQDKLLARAGRDPRWSPS